MEKRKSIILFFAFLLPAVLGFSQQNQDVPAEVYFKDIRNASLEKLPPSFSADLKGRSIEKKLASIPRDSYLDKNKNVTAAVIYSKEKGITIIVQNVDDLYRNLYQDLPRQFFAFDILLSRHETDAFLKKYNISYQLKENNLIILKLRIKDAENTLLLYVNMDNKQIQRLDYLLGEDIMSSTIISYNDYSSEGKNYSIPVRFISKIFANKNDSRPDLFEMDNLRLK